jgi:hypothetical protein
MARLRGSENKTTASAKEAFSKAFSGAGGIVELIAWAKENRTEFYKLYSKLIPTDVNANISGEITFKTLLSQIENTNDLPQIE